MPLKLKSKWTCQVVTVDQWDELVKEALLNAEVLGPDYQIRIKELDLKVQKELKRIRDANPNDEIDLKIHANGQHENVSIGLKSVDTYQVSVFATLTTRIPV